MKPNHFRLKSEDITLAALTVVGIDDISTEQYSEIGNALLRLGKKLMPDKPVSVALISLVDDGSEPIFIYQ